MRIITLLFCCTLIIACNNDAGKKNIPEVTPPVTEVLATDSTSFEDVQAIEKTDYSNNPRVQAYLSRIKEKMNGVPNPLIAMYLGSEFGDYYHFNFIDPAARYLDFGEGKNNLGNFSFGENDTEDNTDLVNKVFVINWAWKETRFACCEGSLDSYLGQIPGITSVELISKQPKVTRAKWVLETDHESEYTPMTKLFIEFKDFSIAGKKKIYIDQVPGIPMGDPSLGSLPNQLEFVHAGLFTKIYADWDGDQLLMIHRVNADEDLEGPGVTLLIDSLYLPKGSVPIISLH